MKSSTLLRLSIPNLERFICYAVMDTTDELDDICAIEAGRRITDRINHYLQGYDVEHWLFFRGHIPFRKNSRGVMKYRRAWMNHLADEFEAEGD